MRRIGGWRLLALCGVVAVMFAAQGCASAGKYIVHRYQDFGEVMDFGITITDTPQVGLYWNSLEVIVFGACDLDGHFFGWGGGQLGYTRFMAKCWGFLYSEEIVGWGPELDTERREEVLIKRRGGIVGILSNLAGPDAEIGSGEIYGSGPNYTPACVHFVPHLGYVGIVWNLRYMEILDFALGWVGLDISGDDGYAVGKWSFPRRRQEARLTETKVAYQFE